MANKFKFDSISDEVLLRRLSEILKESRRVEVELVAHIGEVDRRRLYASQASPRGYTCRRLKLICVSPSRAQRGNIQSSCRCSMTVAFT